MLRPEFSPAYHNQSNLGFNMQKLFAENLRSGRIQQTVQIYRLVSFKFIWLLLLMAPLVATADEVDHFQTTVNKQVGSHFLVVKPVGYDQSKNYPLLIFLHGMGEQGEDIKLLRVHGPYETVKKLGLELIIVAPQSPIDERWDIDMLSAFVDNVLENYPVDRNRVYLTGLSMGGEGAWRLAVRRPHTFAALVPICGFGMPRRAEKISHMPIWAFHGEKDPVVPLQLTTGMIKALEAAGGKPKVTIYPGVGHNSWEPAYNDPELYSWMMEQTLAKTKEK